MEQVLCKVNRITFKAYILKAGMIFQVFELCRAHFNATFMIPNITIVTTKSSVRPVYTKFTVTTREDGLLTWARVWLDVTTGC